MIGNSVFPESLPETLGKDCLVYCDSFAECLKAMETGRADASYAYTYQVEKTVFDDIRINIRHRLHRIISILILVFPRILTVFWSGS